MTMFIAVSIIGDICDIEVVIAVDKRSGLEKFTVCSANHFTIKEAGVSLSIAIVSD